MKQPRITLHGYGNMIVARDTKGSPVASRSTSYNPAALHQLILDIVTIGARIDWKNSTVAKPRWI